jgi:hypothetical protein
MAYCRLAEQAHFVSFSAGFIWVLRRLPRQREITRDSKVVK